MRVLVTGGAGYIGSHTCLELLARGHEVVIADNFCNSSPMVVPRLEAIAGVSIPTHKLDVRDTDALGILFKVEHVDAVAHFAALKAVGESCVKPLQYFDNNVGGTIALLQGMQTAGVATIVFSSSATIYGTPDELPVVESAPPRITNPYGRSKLAVEEILQDVAKSDPEFRYASLRYFNPVGAHSSGRIGEDPRGAPNNLMPMICQVAAGKRDRLRIYGGDWPTPDGTGVRDYLHVVDLAKAHVAALDYLSVRQQNLTVNLGTGRAASVLELVNQFQQATGRSVPYEIVERRAGDVATLWADPTLAQRELGWRAELDLATMCRDAWRWESTNPDGYETR
jgi:UDP-glucose 4-epimerase